MKIRVGIFLGLLVLGLVIISQTKQLNNLNGQVNPFLAIEVDPVLVANVSGFSDQAKFLLYLDRKLVLTNFVVWKENGSFESQGEGIVDGDKIQMATSLIPGAEGLWQEVSMKMPIHETGVRCSRTSALLTLPDGKTKTIPLKSGVFPFVGMVGLNLYTRFYDEGEGGKQLLPIVIPHKKADEILLEQKRTFQRILGGETLEFREFEVKAADMDAIVWIDERGRLVKSEQSEDGAVFIRQGYESLRDEP
jgi:hypothetical protein